MRRTISTLAVTLLLAAALFVPLVFLRPAANSLNTGAATPPPDATPIADATPAAPADEVDPTCGSATVSYDTADPTIANRAEGASVVVIATVESVGTARWNTDDGKPPAFEGDNPPPDVYIYRPVSLSITTLARGDSLGSTLEVNALGGMVGCYSFEFEDSPELKAGQQYAFFIGPALAEEGTTDPSPVTINAAWPVSAGLVETPLEGDVELPLFVATVEAAPVGPFTEPSN